MNRLVVIFISLLLASCAVVDAKGPLFTGPGDASSDKSLLYVFKPDSSKVDYVATCLGLVLNKVEYGCLRGKGYLETELEPGKYEVALINKASFGFKLLEFEVELYPSETTYVEYAFGRQIEGEQLDNRYAGFGGAFSGSHVAAIVNEDYALKKLGQLYNSVNDK